MDDKRRMTERSRERTNWKRLANHCHASMQRVDTTRYDTVYLRALKS